MQFPLERPEGKALIKIHYIYLKKKGGGGEGIKKDFFSSLFELCAI